MLSRLRDIVPLFLRFVNSSSAGFAAGVRAYLQSSMAGWAVALGLTLYITGGVFASRTIYVGGAKPAMIEHRWNGEEPEEAWRVEFRIRPTKQQNLEFRSIKDVLASLRSICEWACVSWFRIVKKRCKNHSERTVIDELWQEVIAGFGAWAEGGQPLMSRVVRSYDPERLIRQAMGTLASALALAGIEPSPFGLDEAMSDLFAISLRTETGQGLTGTTEAERRAHYQSQCAAVQMKMLRRWAAIAHEQRNNEINMYFIEPAKAQ